MSTAVVGSAVEQIGKAGTRGSANSLRRFVDFTYGFLLLRAFTAILLGVNGLPRLFSLRPVVGQVASGDLLALSLAVLAGLIQHYLISSRSVSDTGYGPRFFVADSAIAFTLLWVLNALGGSGTREEVPLSTVWLRLMFFYGLILIRLIVPSRRVPDDGGNEGLDHGGALIGGAGALTIVSLWLSDVGRFVDRPQFDILATIRFVLWRLNLLLFAGAVYAVVGQALGRARTLWIWIPFAVGFLGSIFFLVLLLGLKTATIEWFVGARYGWSVAWLLGGWSALGLMLVYLWKIDKLAVNDLWRGLCNVASALKRLPREA